MRSDGIRISELESGVIRIVDGEKDSGRTYTERFRRIPAIIQALPGDFQQQPLLRIHGCGFPRSDSEEFPVKLIYLIEQTGPLGGHLPRSTWIGIVISIDIPSFRRNFAHGISPCFQQAPELFWRRSSTRKPAAEANNCDRLGIEQVSALQLGPQPLRCQG